MMMMDDGRSRFTSRAVSNPSSYQDGGAVLGHDMRLDVLEQDVAAGVALDVQHVGLHLHAIMGGSRHHAYTRQRLGVSPLYLMCPSCGPPLTIDTHPERQSQGLECFSAMGAGLDMARLRYWA